MARDPLGLCVACWTAAHQTGLQSNARLALLEHQRSEKRERGIRMFGHTITRLAKGRNGVCVYLWKVASCEASAQWAREAELHRREAERFNRGLNIMKLELNRLLRGRQGECVRIWAGRCALAGAVAAAATQHALADRYSGIRQVEQLWRRKLSAGTRDRGESRAKRSRVRECSVRGRRVRRGE